MPTSCGARSCLSIFLSYDRGPPKFPVARVCLAKPIRRKKLSNKPHKRGGTDNSILFHHAPVSTARPRTRDRGLFNRRGSSVQLPRRSLTNTRVEFRDATFPP